MAGVRRSTDISTMTLPAGLHETGAAPPASASSCRRQVIVFVVNAVLLLTLNLPSFTFSHRGTAAKPVRSSQKNYSCQPSKDGTRPLQRWRSIRRDRTHASDRVTAVDIRGTGPIEWRPSC
jgi:hypothetical protein